MDEITLTEGRGGRIMENYDQDESNSNCCVLYRIAEGRGSPNRHTCVLYGIAQGCGLSNGHIGGPADCYYTQYTLFLIESVSKYLQRNQTVY